VRLLALRPLLAYCASIGWQWKWLWRSRWNVDWQGKPKFSEKTCPSATFVHHRIPHEQTRVWTRAAAVGSRRLTAWAMARPRDYVTKPIYSTNRGKSYLVWATIRNQILCKYVWKSHRRLNAADVFKIGSLIISNHDIAADVTLVPTSDGVIYESSAGNCAV
jgi:hypothetical protein